MPFVLSCYLLLELVSSFFGEEDLLTDYRLDTMNHSSFENNPIHYVSQEHDNRLLFQQAIGSDANYCTLDFQGSDAASSSNLYHNLNSDRYLNQSKSDISTSLSHSTYDQINIDYDNSMAMNPIENILTSIESMSKLSLLDLANGHGLKFNKELMSLEEMKFRLSDHLCKGCCLSSTYEGCMMIKSKLNNNIKEENVDCLDVNALLIFLLSHLLPKIKLRPLRRLLTQHNISFSLQDSLSSLRKKLRAFIKLLKKAKYQEQKEESELAKKKEKEEQRESRRLRIHESWPEIVSQDQKNKIIDSFHEQTSSETLSTFTCAACGEATLNSAQCKVPLSSVDLEILKWKNINSGTSSETWNDVVQIQPPLPINEGPLKNVVLDPEGVIHDLVDGNDDIQLLLCKDCFSSIKKKKIPALSFANSMYLGPIPSELKDLTIIEEAMIARCRAKCWVVQLKEENPSVITPDSQRGMKGHVIIYPQRPSEIVNLLPTSKQDILTPICILFVGSTPPTAKWLREKAKPLCVRREKVRAALEWLKINNPLYRDVTINHALLNEFEEEEILPFHIEHIPSSDASDTLTSGYDNGNIQVYGDLDLHSNLNSFLPTESQHENEFENNEKSTPLPFENVVITDIDGHAPPNELRAAALRHIKRGGGYIQIPHEAKPVNEFFNPELFPLIYPTLFPYGIGGLEDRQRLVKVSLKRHVKHLFNLKDKRFQEHYSFLFTAFNILQRRSVLLHTSLKVKKKNFDKIASDFASVSPETIHIVTERISHGDSVTANNENERKVLNLMKQVNAVTSNVPASSSSRVAMRNEIRALIMEKGLPSFFVTINPADVYNPLVKFLGGADIDIDNLLPEQVPNYWEQSVLIAKNPFVAAKFFNIYIKAFINSVLGYNSKEKKLDGGILGTVNAYYGCVEAQGRGTLHCHMIIWLEGGLNPDEIKQKIIDQGDDNFRKRLISFLDDTISNNVPEDPDPDLTTPFFQYHPCSVRKVDITNVNHANMNELDKHDLFHKKDFHNLVKTCQLHRHSKTCYKYWKGPPEPKECRFDLNENNICDETTFNTETGELCFRCLNGLVNNFNETMLKAIRCNMDIKFIGSGPAAKAIIYYITNYITKSQLKTHVAYAALELATKKLGEYNPDDDDITIRAKKLLQKCAYSIISHQELSAQQVASYLMDYEDHYTSHLYRNLYWPSFENHIQREQPSPECYLTNEKFNNFTDTTNINDPEIDLDLDNILKDSDNNANVTTRDLEAEDSFENEEIVHQNVDSEAEVFENELSISINTSGELIARSTQIEDYQLRNEKLENISVWDFISSLEKSPNSRLGYKNNRSNTTTTNLNEIEIDDDDTLISENKKKSQK